MRANGRQNDAFRDYLLGGLSESEKEELEKRLMTREEDFEELLVEEDELVDAYQRDELSEHDRLRFETHFLCTPERRRKLRFSATLREYVRAHWKRRPRRARGSRGTFATFWDRLFKFLPHPPPAWGVVATVLALTVAAGVWSAIGYLRAQEELERVSSERGALLNERADLQQQLAAVRLRAEEESRLPPAGADIRPPVSSEVVAAPPVVSFTLSPGLFRGAGERARVRIPPGSSLVTLQLDVGLDEFAEYRAVLYEAEGDEVWALSKIRARNTSTTTLVPLTLPSQLLASADYYVKLDGVAEDGTREGLGRYDIRVTRE